MIYWFMGYPCFTGIGNKFNPFAWLSEKLNNDAQNAVVTFKTEFDTIRRVKFHMILFMTMPDNVKIEMTEDLNTWWTAREEFKTIVIILILRIQDLYGFSGGSIIMNIQLLLMPNQLRLF